MAVSDFVTQTKAAIAAITDPQISTAVVDINNCDREPIHIPAAIQPHGILLVLREIDWQIVQASQNVGEYLGRPLDSLLNHPLSEILTAAQIQAIERCLAMEFEAVNPLRFEIWVGGGIRTFAGVVHRSEAAVVLESDTPRQSRWLDEWDRLKGGCPHRESLAWLLELTALISDILLSDVTFYGLEFETDRRDCVASRPKGCATEILQLPLN